MFSAFFVATQFFFTICFVGMLIAIGLVLMYLLCIDDYYRVKVLRWIGFDLMVAGEVFIERGRKDTLRFICKITKKSSYQICNFALLSTTMT